MRLKTNGIPFSEESNKEDVNMSKDDNNQEEYISSLVFNKNTVEKHNLSQSCNYSFVWHETGVLEPGVEFQASEVSPTAPKE